MTHTPPITPSHHTPQQFDAQMRPVRQANAAPLLSGAFLIQQSEVEALQERDRRQVRGVGHEKEVVMRTGR